MDINNLNSKVTIILESMLEEDIILNNNILNFSENYKKKSLSYLNWSLLLIVNRIFWLLYTF